MEQRGWSRDDGTQEDGVGDDGEWEGENLLKFSLKPTILDQKTVHISYNFVFSQSYILSEVDPQD